MANTTIFFAYSSTGASLQRRTIFSLGKGSFYVFVEWHCRAIRPDQSNLWILHECILEILIMKLCKLRDNPSTKGDRITMTDFRPWSNCSALSVKQTDLYHWLQLILYRGYPGVSSVYVISNFPYFPHFFAGTTWTGVSRAWRRYVCFWRTRSNIQKTFSCCVVTTSALPSTGSTVSTMNVRGVWCLGGAQICVLIMSSSIFNFVCCVPSRFVFCISCGLCIRRQAPSEQVVGLFFYWGKKTC